MDNDKRTIGLGEQKMVDGETKREAEEEWVDRKEETRKKMRREIKESGAVKVEEGKE